MQVVVAEFDRWEAEWTYAEQMLKHDVRNNSAWAQRAFLVSHRLAARLRCLAAADVAEHRQNRHGDGAHAASGDAQQRSGDCVDAGAAGAHVLESDNDDGGDAAFLGAMLVDDAAAAGGAPCLGRNSGGEKGEASHQPATGAAASAGTASATRADDLDASFEKCVRSEVAFVGEALQRVARNESSWNYLCGLQHLILSVLAAQHAGDQLASASAASSGGEVAAGAAAAATAPVADAARSIFGGNALQGAVQQRASECLAASGPRVRVAAAAALAEAAQSMFAVPLQALEHCADNVPARAVLLRAYAAAAVHERGQEGRQKASRAAEALASWLQRHDPVHRGWYAALLQEAHAVVESKA